MGFKGSTVPSLPRNQPHHPARALAQLTAQRHPPPEPMIHSAVPEILPTASAPASRWVLVAGEAVLPVTVSSSQLRYRPCFIGG